MGVTSATPLAQPRGMPGSDRVLLIPVKGHTGVRLYVPLDFQCKDGELVFGYAEGEAIARGVLADPRRILAPMPFELIHTVGENAKTCGGTVTRGWRKLNLRIFFNEIEYVQAEVTRIAQPEISSGWHELQVGAITKANSPVRIRTQYSRAKAPPSVRSLMEYLWLSAKTTSEAYQKLSSLVAEQHKHWIKDARDYPPKQSVALSTLDDPFLIDMAYLELIK